MELSNKNHELLLEVERLKWEAIAKDEKIQAVETAWATANSLAVEHNKQIDDIKTAVKMLNTGVGFLITDPSKELIEPDPRRRSTRERKRSPAYRMQKSTGSCKS
eukprot:SAG31_NODE_3320_length_4418_cov_5.799259_4_plen_105_part_00